MTARSRQAGSGVARPRTGQARGRYRDRNATDRRHSCTVVAQHLEVEYADATDDKGGAEDMQQVCAREQPSGMPADMPQRGMLQQAQSVA